MNMWAAYATAVANHLLNAQVLFDRLHVVQHLNRAVDEVRRNEMRRLSRRERTPFRRIGYRLLKSPRNLSLAEQDRISRLVRWNNPIVRACLLKELFQLFWDYDVPELARTPVLNWIRKAKRTRLTPFKVFLQLREGHLEGILA